MKSQTPPRGSLFLMEIIMNILLFCILLVICLQLIMKAHTLTNDTNALHQAVTTCNNIANIYQSTDGSLEKVKEYYPGEYKAKEFILYYDTSFCDTSKENATYTLTAIESPTDITDTSLQISVTKGSLILHQINVYHYTPLSPSREGKEADHE